VPRTRLLLATALAVTLVAASAAPAAADDRPTAVVALGDSAASGEGAGDYVPGTRGERGDWCHRSPHAYVTDTGLASEAVNLACSGARSADVAFGSGGGYGEQSQAVQLMAVAQRYRITTVVLQVGANDDAALTATGIACIEAFLNVTVAPCRTTLGPLVAGRMAATATKVEAAARDVQEAMLRAGYRPGSWTFVMASYAAPVTEKMLPIPAARGCPYSRDDAQWGRTVLFPALSTALAGVAERVGARFLDLDRATEGYEACTRTPSSQEWQRRLTVDPEALVHGRLDAVGFHLAQESFHPDAEGHAAIGRCLGDLVRSGADTGSCMAGRGGYSTTRS
jgi:lysophospholipase L1-like esterase